LYAGSEVAFAGWISTFMIKIRYGDPSKMGYVTTGYLAGLTVGRMSLGFLVGHFRRGELFVAAFIVLAIVCLFVIWFVPVLVVSAVLAGLFGFVIGPVFPTVVVVALKKLPTRLHVSGISFAAAMGGAGATVFPFVNGIIANHYGPEVLCPLCVGLFGTMLLCWLVIIKWF
jgi:fucose permease